MNIKRLFLWAISNREDFTALGIFMNALRKSCRTDLCVDVFMSDMADMFYNAMCII